MQKRIGLLIPARFEYIIDAILHLQNHDEIFWTVGKNIKKCKEFSFPMTGLLYLNKNGDIRCSCKIKDIMPFSQGHYKSVCKKPKKWISEWKKDRKDKGATLIITKIKPFYYKTSALKDYRGKKVQPSQNCIKILIPKAAVKK